MTNTSAENLNYKSVGKQEESVLYKEVWNAAIEEAAEKGFIFNIGAAEEIRKLKK